MLTDRQIKILEFIVNNFIDTGLPTGSRTISKTTLLDLSAATIRNEMSDLEELGYIVQPHISAGRIPSELGIRFHIDNLIESLNDFQNVNDVFSQLSSSDGLSKNLLQRASQILSRRTNLTAIVTGRPFNNQNLRNLKLIRLSDNKTLLVLVGHMEDYKVIELEVGGYSQRDLDRLSKLLLDACARISISDLNYKKFRELRYIAPEFSTFIDYIMAPLKKSLEDLKKQEIYISGREHLINDAHLIDENLPEKLLKFFKDHDAMTEFLKTDIEDVHVKIGHEIGHELFEGFSVIESLYGSPGNPIGTIALIGPIRMDYQKMMNEVGALKNTLTQIYTGIHL